MQLQWNVVGPSTGALPVRTVHKENHLIERIGWLRAAVLGANDGLISTSSLIVGVAAATPAFHEILVAGAAGLVAGAMSMAAGEYVSVSSQADTEKADMARERDELATQPEAELLELAAIYEQRGLSPDLALQVAKAMTAKDAFEAHARDELGLTSHVMAQPIQAAFTSALTFSTGAALPLIVALLAPPNTVTWTVSLTCLFGLAALGAIGARTGGANIWKPTTRVVFWGAVAMATTAAIGFVVGKAV